MCYDNFEGAEINIYTKDGQSFSICVEKLELVVMLKSIGFELASGTSFNQFDNEALLKILNGEINPFRLKSVE